MLPIVEIPVVMITVFDEDDTIIIMILYMTLYIVSVMSNDDL